MESLILNWISQHLPSVIRKLRGPVWSRQRYRRLVEFLQEANANKCLRHASEIRSHTIDLLEELAPALRHPGIVAALKTRDDAGAFTYAVQAVRRLRPDVALVDILRSARGIGREKHIAEWFEMWLQKAKLPTPPWPGTERLEPLVTVKQLTAAARLFRNCLDCQVYKVISEQKYYYVWRGRQSAVAEIERDLYLGWVVGEAKGIRNRSLTAATRAAIVAEFAKGGLISVSPDARDRVVGTVY